LAESVEQGSFERLSGDRGRAWNLNALTSAASKTCGHFNAKPCQPLTRLDILDIMNWLGTALWLQRLAKMAVPYGDLNGTPS
jgi:hypothetical protein